MSLNQYFVDVGAQLQEFLWRDLPRKTVKDDIERLEQVIRQGAAALTRRRAVMDEIKRSIGRKERREVWLATRVEVYLHVGDRANAWSHALELDRLRDQLNSQRDQLKLLKRANLKQQLYLEELQEQLADLQCRVY
jgi:hypothetical protein